MESSRKIGKIIGTLEVLFGLSVLTPLFAFARCKLIFDEYTCFLVRYWKIILYTNGCLFFVVFGILSYIGILVPYFSASKYEKAKIHLFGSVLSVPIWVSMSTTLFVVANNSHFETIFIVLMILWILFVIYLAWIFFSSVSVLKKGHKAERKP